MNFTIKHIGNGYIEATVIEYATAVTRAEADSLAADLERLVDGRLREKIEDDVRWLVREEHREELREREARTLATLDSMAKAYRDELARIRAGAAVANQ